MQLLVARKSLCRVCLPTTTTTGDSSGFSTQSIADSGGELDEEIQEGTSTLLSLDMLPPQSANEEIKPRNVKQIVVAMFTRTPPGILHKEGLVFQNGSLAGKTRSRCPPASP